MQHVRRFFKSKKAQFHNTSSSSSYKDPVLVWASSNREVAQTCLQRPPDDRILTRPTTTTTTLTNFEEYWKWRGWDFMSADVGDETMYAQNLTTSPLSDPATIAFLLLPLITLPGMTRTTTMTTATTTATGGTATHDQTNVGIESTNDSNTSNKKRHSVRLCCLGARAEASLPTEFWKEILLIAKGTLGWTNVDLTLDLIGPELIRRPSVKHSCSKTQGTITTRWLYSGKFHELWDQLQKRNDPTIDRQENNDSSPNTTSIIEPLYWDAFVLLNPGLGHDHLEKDWNPTLDILLLSDGSTIHQQQPRRPLLLTAHSWLDAQRDGMALAKYLVDQVPLYEKNPWSCRITNQDPFDPTHLVQSNFCYHIIVPE